MSSPLSSSIIATVFSTSKGCFAMSFNHRSFQKPALFIRVFDRFPEEKRIPGKTGHGSYPQKDQQPDKSKIRKPTPAKKTKNSEPLDPQTTGFRFLARAHPPANLRVRLLLLRQLRQRWLALSAVRFSTNFPFDAPFRICQLHRVNPILLRAES